MPNSPTRLKARLSEALARVESLEREKLNAKETESKETVKSLLEDLKENNLVCVLSVRERESECVCGGVCVLCLCVCVGCVW